MARIATISLLLCLQTVITFAKTEICPLLGQQYPPPTQLANEPEFQEAVKNINTILNGRIKKSPYNETTFSLGLFNVADEGLSYQYHYTDALTSKSKYGTQHADADSIYRIGSISKLLTMYTGLIQLGDRWLNDPVAEHIPEFRNKDLLDKASLVPDWEEITIGDLAGQMSGLQRDYTIQELAVRPNAAVPSGTTVYSGLPNLTKSELDFPKCGWETLNNSYVFCTPEQYFSGVASEAPIFPTAYTPVYSNLGFATLGHALQNIAGKPFNSLFNENLVQKLGLKGTYPNVPKTIPDNAVVPGNPNTDGWSADLGFFGVAGGHYSTVNDFMAIGKSILNSTLLTKSVTNRWLKPTSFVETLTQGVGRPWEIYRRTVNGQSIVMYSKGGDLPVYHSAFFVIPQYDFGVAVLTAGNPNCDTCAEETRDELPGIIVENILPVIDAIAKKQALKNFAGTYGSSQDNSSITIEAHIDQGLTVTKWISNGTNMLSGFFEMISPDLIYRIVPNQLFGGNQVGFTSFYSSKTTSSGSDQWYLGGCSGWYAVDPYTYGLVPLGQMVFEVDESGKATSVDLRGLRATWQRQS